MCDDYGQAVSTTIHNDVWFEFVPQHSDDYTFSTCKDADYDSKIAVYVGSCGSLVALGCNDDGVQCVDASSSVVLGGLVRGLTYFIQVGGSTPSSVGSGNLTVAAGSLAFLGLGTGPDIAVSGVGNNDWRNFGTANGIRAYSWATTSCNVGDEVVNWYSGIGNDHPLIAQNMYRVQDGRIEMLGYSFLKHGFCAINENSCGSCQNTSCDTLGLGCADTYSSGLNDGSGGASKRSVNATLGTYSGNPGPVGDPGTINGRLQVIETELTGTLIAETQYVSEHDHSNGLARNNASWRQVAVADGGDLSGSGPVNMFDPGIFAWQALSGATINEVVNVDEGGAGVNGYYFLGFQVTDLGGGQWRYEYALANFNSDRSARSFELPVPASTTLSNVFFRDIDHHSGDPYSDVDWSFSNSGGVMRWETETYGQNPDANALRWGTLYNFGFTANGAPEAAVAAIGLFKPGTGSSLSSSIDGPGAGSLIDCNNNGISDLDDILNGTSLDCNNNSTPDECESDCDLDGVPDDCEADCNGNGTPDECEAFTDCNANGIPDDCEADCDSDGIPDACESDCDADGIPDDCEADCNSNGTPDDCESFTDCNGNGIPDECDADCDGDGLPDDCEVDCNNNGTPDDCESFTDCNGNGIPDDCDADCNADGIPDDCEADCNGNGLADVCEGLPDCNADGIPDECEPDCDSDGTPDSCEVDCDGNGTPDECESIADCNGNGIPDGCDISSGLSQDCNGNSIPDECDLDTNGNGIPDDCESVDALASSDTSIRGTFSGSFLATHAGDYSYEAITEEASNGNPAKRRSMLEHIWTFNVAAGTSVDFHVRAHHTANSEGDNFTLAWSPDNSTYTDLILVSKTTDDGSYQSAGIPASASGTIYIRVVDNDQSQDNSALDTVFIDHMFVRTSLTPQLPAAPSDLAATTISQSQISISWVDSSGNEDNFELESSIDGISFSLLATLAAGTTSYFDTGLASSTTYWYRVRAVNSVGSSAYSNADSDTTLSPGASDASANGEVSIDGSVRSGSYLDTKAADGSYEEIREDRTGGPPSNRVSFMEHRWTFDVASGSSIDLQVRAHHSSNPEGDDFVFAWSTDGTTFTDVLTVTKTADDDVSQVASLPATVSGTVWIRAMDTDRMTGNGQQDTLFVDSIIIRTQ
ncbi:MAG: hypothetical protein ACI841_000253 [Planctomycetota bacterium]|jgi:hypothetical protein